MKLVYPVIVVPGITATYLRDEYPLPPDYVWKVISKDYERIALHPNDLRYEAIEPARVLPGQIYEIAYKELVEELRFNLREKEDEPVPVYPFGYDWRMPLHIVEAQLDKFIEEVINRTKLLKHYHKAGYAKDAQVNLVGHSMGGLIITGYLQSKGKASPVHKVVTLATPYKGSFEAVIKIVTGTADLGIPDQGSREREAARITPALYHLMPSFSNGLTTDTDIPRSLFNPAAWQEGVVASIAEFIRLKGLPTTSRNADASKLLAQLLKEAKSHRDSIEGFELAQAGLTDKEWLTIVGVDATTRVHLTIKSKNGKPLFVLSSDDRKNEWSNNDPVVKRFTGDGTVPYEGAVPSFLSEENLVCITPDDYGYWELQDRTVSKVAGFHGILPNMNMLHRLIVRFLADRSDWHGNTWGRPAPGVTVTNWKPPLILKSK